MMETRVMGKTGLQASALAFGTMSFGGDADEAESKAMYAACMDAGINLFDCANVYNGGEAERILGRLMAPHRDELIITTKAYFPTGSGPNARGSSRYHLVAAVEKSLRRLNTDRIDLLFLHRFDEQTDLDQSLRALEDLICQGKVLYPAVSNFSAWQTMKALGVAERLNLNPLVAIQPMYNLVKRQAEVELLPMARDQRLAVFPYSPLGGGLLTGKYTKTAKPEVGRLVDNPMYQTRYGLESYFACAEGLSAIAQRLDLHPASLAIAWVMAHPAVTAPILGARSAAQLQAGLDAAGLDISRALYEELAGLFPAPPPATDRNEEGSRHHYGARLAKARS